MQLENVIKRLIKFINTRTEALSITVTSGGVDNMEKYQYIIGQINALEATRQETFSFTFQNERDN
jgi:hypothetical protein